MFEVLISTDFFFKELAVSPSPPRLTPPQSCIPSLRLSPRTLPTPPAHPSPTRHPQPLHSFYLWFSISFNVFEKEAVRPWGPICGPTHAVFDIIVVLIFGIFERTAPSPWGQGGKKWVGETNPFLQQTILRSTSLSADTLN